MDLNLRLEILKDNNVISIDTLNKILKSIEVINRLCGLKLDEENGSMLITHMAIAIERVNKGEFTELADDFIYEQIRLNDKFSSSKKVLQELEENLNINFPESEKRFILMHLCTLLDKEDVKF